jgi:hypothetical protein
MDKRMDRTNRAVLVGIAILIVMGLGCAITSLSKSMAPSKLTIIPSGIPQVVKTHITSFGIKVPDVTTVKSNDKFYDFEETLHFEPGYWYEVEAYFTTLGGPAPYPSFWTIVRLTRHEMPFRDLSIRPL